MHENIIPFTHSDEWIRLAGQAADDPRKLRAALLSAINEITILRRQCIRAGMTPEVGRHPDDLAKDWPETSPKEGKRLKFKRPPSGKS